MNEASNVRDVAGPDALRASLAYHFTDGSVDDVFDRHASVQFDPLSPLGANHDLVFAARVPDYRIGDWHEAVYRQRRAYDGWDKQASLVGVEGQPARRLFHAWLGERWMAEVEENWPNEIDLVLQQLEGRGPLEASEVDLDVRIEAWGDSWYGPRLAKRILRALWHSGTIATAGRRHGRHLYDLVERVLPSHVLAQPTPAPDDALRQLILDRHRATGILRPEAAPEVWSVHVSAAERRSAIEDLVQAGRLVPVDVEGMRHHAVPAWIASLESDRGTDGVRFIAPLDPIVWDRAGVRRAFGFDYVWEVYKPADRRRWGWYVLPVVHRDRFVGRIEGVRETRRDEPDVWRVQRWWWEDSVRPSAGASTDPRLLEDVERAAARFASYLGVGRCVVRGGVPRAIASALRAGARKAGHDVEVRA